jgi:hypothetical protein
MDLLLLLLAAYAVTFGLMQEKLPRFNAFLFWLPVGRVEGENLFKRMFECAYCTGFHSGWLVWLASGVSPSGLQGVTLAEIPSKLAGVLLFALASAAFCYALDAVIKRLES